MKLDVLRNHIEDARYGKKINEVTISMPFQEYHDLMEDLMNKPFFNISNAASSCMLIKHIMLDGIKVNIVDGELGVVEEGGIKPGQKFFKALQFESPRKAPVIQMQTLPHRA